MKRTLLFFFALLMGISGAWAQITVGPSTGTYMDGWDGTNDGNEWAAKWKSTATTADGTDVLLKFSGESGMNATTGDIYSNQTYTLEAPAGYVISGYTFNGTATNGDVTITPAGGSGTTITSGNSLPSPLDVTVRAQSTTFYLSGSGYISGLNLVVTITPFPVTIAYCPSYTTSGCNHSLPSYYGSFSGQTYTTNANSGLAGLTVTASSDLTIDQQTVNVNAYGKCFKLVTAAANTDYTVTMQAPTGYVITGYRLACSANSNNNRHTLTSQDGSVVVEVTSPPNQNYTSKVFEVSGLNSNSTSFTIKTANGGNALYLPIFQIHVAKSSEVVNDTYNVIFNGSQVATETVTRMLESSTEPAIPNVLQKEYCSYEYYSDANCTTPLSTLTTSGTTIYVKCTYPFTVSSSFATATWYYAKINTTKFLRADDNKKDGSGRYQTSNTNGRTDEYKWAFFGNPYDNIYVMNKAQGNGKYLYKGDSQPTFQTLADPTADNKAMWVIRNNSKGGFALQNVNGGTNWCINDAGGNGNLGYWNNTANFSAAGSNWVIEEASASDKTLLYDLLTTATTLYTSLNSGAGKLGYPTTAALSTFNTAIGTAQSVYNDASGDYYSAYTTLQAAIETLKASIIYTPRTDVYYTIVNSRGAMVYDPNHSGSVDTQNDNAEYIWYGSTTPDATNPNNLWGFIESDGHYYMYNVGKQQFASVGNGSYGSTWIFSDTPAYITLDDGIAHEIVAPKTRIRATIATTGSSYTMSVSTSYTGPVITYDANGDGGVPMVFAESSYAMDADVTAAIEALIEDVTPYRNALKDVIDGCASISFGAGLNQYASNSTYTDALAAANTAYNNSSATKSELQDAKTDLETAIAGLSINLPGAGFYRIKGKTSGKYLSNGNIGADGTKYTVGADADASTIFYFTGSALVNFAKGANVDLPSWSWNTNESALSLLEFHDGLTNGGYAISNGVANNNKPIFLYDNGDGGTPSVDRGAFSPIDASTNARYTSWYLEEVTTLPITLNAFDGAHYSTFYSPVNVEVSGATAYTLTLKSNYLSATEIDDDVIPANTGVILVSNSNDATVTATLTLTDKTPTVSSGTGDLTGTVAAATSSESDYIFTVVDNEIGFYKNGFGTVKGFKAFYRPSDSSVRGFAINFGLNDAITDILHQVSPKNVYDLQGRRVNEPAKGLYIINGKKVIK